jgi:hypothetical protein
VEKNLDIEKILNEKITNVRCTEINAPNMELFAKAFYDIYLKDEAI